MRRRSLLIPLTLLTLSAPTLYRAYLMAQRGDSVALPAYDASARCVLLQFGVTDKEPKSWTGRVEANAGGAVVSLRGLHFVPTDRVNGADFTFATRLWPQPGAVDLSPLRPGLRPIFPNGVYALLKGGDQARFTVTGGTGITFSLGELKPGVALSFDGGNTSVEEVPQPMQLSATGEADYPSLASGPAGRLAVAWQEFLGDRDRLDVREWDGRKWIADEPLESAETRDILRPSAAYDGQGRLHIVWAAQVDGNWDLYERRKESGAWSAVSRLTQAAGSDFHQKTIGAPNGDLLLAWQGSRAGQSDIFLKRFTGGAWGEEIKVSDSPANDWEPSLAAAPDGTVWVGWDTYDRGNYDVVVRAVQPGGKLGAPRAITSSSRFEAHASLACDPQGRLWIAFDEAEANWGKDYGYLVKERGNPLYQSRRVRVVRLSGDRLEEPEAGIADAFPLGMPGFLQNALPVITSDGRLTLFALQLSFSRSVIEVWGSGGVWETVALTLDGAGWHRSRVMPDSAGANDIRAAAVNSRDGSVWGAWAADLRGFQNGAPQHQTVLAANLSRVPETEPGGEIRMRPFVEQPELSFATHPREAADLRTIRGYRMRSGDASYQIVRGDLHRHTSLSADGVGDGSLWDFYRYALDAASLDFSTVTDHQGGGTSYNWWKAQKSTDLFYAPGRLTTIYAYERSVLYPNGHRNMVFTKRGIPILPIDPAENRNGAVRSADAVLPYLRKYNGIAFRHTSATDQGTDWADHDNTLEPMVEVYQGHRVVYEHEGGPKGATATKLYMQRSGYRPAGFIWHALAKGYRLGFEAASDHCSTHLSYSCILTTGTSREALVDAMRKRHSYGATDNIVMDFRVEGGGRQYIQGDETPVLPSYSLVVNALGTGPIKRVDVIHNESYVYAVTPTGKSSVNFKYVDGHPVAGENRYYIRLEQEDGNMAWSSPVWVRYGR